MSDNRYPNSGVLFRNTRKLPGDRKPDYTGNCNIDGREFWLDAWIKDGAKGKFMSVSLKPKDGQATGPAPRPRDEGADALEVVHRHFPGARVVRDERKGLDLDDEIPF